ncbi:MAG TPA: DUF6456 domain-containing protein [Hyphomicrobiales bacterium]|nr:DUF6456 domain-containing protein [Hyphomicrobiales bacterium]
MKGRSRSRRQSAPAPKAPGTAIESPLEWLHRRRLVGAAAFAAGERLRQDFTFGQLMPRTTTNWELTTGRDRHAGGRPGDLADGALAARQRFGHALEAVGPELHGILVDVCCFLKRLEQVEQERRWPVRSAKVVLTLALDRLARHYGYDEEAVGRGKGGRIVQWGAADYRPGIGAEEGP